MAIECCHYCVAPKRYPGCHDHCHEYIEQKAKHDAEKAEIDKKRAVNLGIYTQRGNKVYEARKRRWKGR